MTDLQQSVKLARQIKHVRHDILDGATSAQTCLIICVPRGGRRRTGHPMSYAVELEEVRGVEIARANGNRRADLAKKGSYFRGVELNKEVPYHGSPLGGAPTNIIGIISTRGLDQRRAWMRPADVPEERVIDGEVAVLFMFIVGGIAHNNVAPRAPEHALSKAVFIETTQLVVIRWSTNYRSKRGLSITVCSGRSAQGVTMPEEA
ncbi:hypothetical protein C8R44DRAFT_745751 [Mycena epipterygia]|nr:hypothetical protein C8R44DRAFT_745751 [Mycena epipterygia]